MRTWGDHTRFGCASAGLAQQPCAGPKGKWELRRRLGLLGRTAAGQCCHCTPASASGDKIGGTVEKDGVFRILTLSQLLTKRAMVNIDLGRIVRLTVAEIEVYTWR